VTTLEAGDTDFGSGGGFSGVEGSDLNGFVDVIDLPEGDRGRGDSATGDSCRLNIEFDTGATLIRSLARSAYKRFVSVGFAGAA
jgi:hypothetical protein